MGQDDTKSTGSTEVRTVLITTIGAIAAAIITTWGTISTADTRLRSNQEQIETSRQELEELQRDTDALRSDTVGVPVGTVVASVLAPTEFVEGVGDNTTWVLADGREVPATRFAEMTNDRAIPDLRGVFLRGMNEGRADEYADPDRDTRNVGEPQGHQIQQHNHSYTRHDARATTAAGFSEVDTYEQGDNDSMYERHFGAETGNALAAAAGSETRPSNVAVYYYIRVD